MNPLHILAVDQRGWLLEALYGPGASVTEERRDVLGQIKLMVAEGAAAAAKNGAPGEIGLLVDELYGAQAARFAAESGLTLAMPVEKANQEVLTPEFGADWIAHLDEFRPALPKLLIWHNVETDRAALDRQLESLAEIGGRLNADGRPLMLEILAFPTESQLARHGGDRGRFDREALPELTLAAIEEVHSTGVTVDVWKLEGMPDGPTFRRVREKAGGRCLVLGRNAPQEQVDRWMAEAAAAGFEGFAIGRSVWWESVRAWVDGAVSREAVVETIAQNYTHCCQVFSASR
jgi:myo-inositol catabolism protein IolC